MKKYLGKKIAVLGLGVEGQSTVDWMLSKGAFVSGFDEGDRDNADPTALHSLESQGATLAFGALPRLTGYDLIVRSPGVRLSHPALVAAKKTGAVVTSATQIFLEECPGVIVGVTGTKGKGTTCALIYEILKNAKRQAHLGGNIGIPMLSFLDRVSSESVVILEISSFQLMDVTLSPHIAVVLMVTNEHQDYHVDENEYIKAKSNLTKFQDENDYLIVNRDYPNSNRIASQTRAKIIEVSMQPTNGEGCFIENEHLVIRLSGKKESLLPVKEIFLPGRHNWENACAAAMTSALLGVKTDIIAGTLKTFKGLEHRLEFIREVRGVKYYNDSFATTPESTIAAIRSFSVPIVLIIGGSSKHSDFQELGNAISEANNIEAIIGIGLEWENIKKTISRLPPHVIEGKTTMREIVASASKLALSPGVVILSPACASFDMFRNYKDRGAQFKSAVNALK